MVKKRNKKFEVMGYRVMLDTFIVDAPSKEEALELAMEMTHPLQSELIEEGYNDPEEIKYV